MHKILITRLYFKMGPFVSSGTVKLSTKEETKRITGFVAQRGEPIYVEIEGDSELTIKHERTISVAIQHVETAMPHKFDKVQARYRKSGICPSCGKKAARSTVLFQTLNPYNRNKNGQPKSSDEIRAELAQKGKQWVSEPVYHAKCEP